jgi:phosphatidate cytidylyltransferase
MTADLLLPGSISVGSVLAAGGLGIVTTELIRRRSVWSSVLTQRWLTWLVLGSLWLSAAVWPVVLVMLLTVLAIVGVHEYSQLRPALVRADRAMMVAWAAVAVGLLAFTPAGVAELFTAMAVAAIVFPLLSQDVRNGGRRIGDQLMGFALVVLPMMTFHQIVIEWGGTTFFVVGLAVALGDVAAFVTGSTVGRRRLAPGISPNKTVAGAVGGLAGATLGVVVAIAAGLVGWTALWLAPVVAVAAVAGDLFVSLLKRRRGVKDAGSWLPGFGGLLDRIDSLLVVALVAYLALYVMGGI